MVIVIMSILFKSDFEETPVYDDMHSFLNWSAIIYIIACVIALVLFFNGGSFTTRTYMRICIITIYTLLYVFYI